MFFRGDRAFVLTNGGQWGPIPVEPVVVDDIADAEADFAASSGPIEPPAEFVGPAAVIMEIDLSDPAALRVAGTLRIEGRYLSARAIDDHVRLALTSPPNQLPWVFPRGETGEELAEQTNRQVIAGSSLADWTPGYELSTDAGDTSGDLLACDRMHHPAEFAGFDVVTVLDLDLSEGLAGGIDRDDAVGVLAAGETVYSSTDRFYVATTSWPRFEGVADGEEVWSDDVETDLHAFAIAAGEPTRYVASGSVAGTLLNQFSMDEFDDRLRVITTDGSPWDGSGASETSLVVLEEQGDRLVPIGSVGGLGKGEQLYSARLLDDIGFAVTFRQIDPFYVLDLRDPTNPRVTGELKIPGVSTYLHPVGERRVLGIGQDATEEGRTTGLKLSVFDVSDPAAPQEISVWTMPGANSPAEWDHRAFQMVGSTAIVPVQSADFAGVVLFDVGDAITEIGRIEHVGDGTTPSSDCRPVDGSGLTPEASELWWMIQEPTVHVQLCGTDEVGGWGDWSCDRIPADELQYWFGDPEAAGTDLAAIGAGDGDRVELCWDEGDWQRQVKRSLVVDGTLWTMSERHLQANDLDGLGLIANLPIT
jgi:hypothetical protein